MVKLTIQDSNHVFLFQRRGDESKDSVGVQDELFKGIAWLYDRRIYHYISEPWLWKCWKNPPPTKTTQTLRVVFFVCVLFGGFVFQEFLDTVLLSHHKFEHKRTTLLGACGCTKLKGFKADLHADGPHFGTAMCCFGWSSLLHRKREQKLKFTSSFFWWKTNYATVLQNKHMDVFHSTKSQQGHWWIGRHLQ